MSEKEIDPFDLKAGVPPIEGQLRPKPQMADRISPRVLKVVFGVVILLFVVFMISLDAMDKPVKKAPVENKKTAVADAVDPKNALFASGGKDRASTAASSVDSASAPVKTSLVAPNETSAPLRPSLIPPDATGGAAVAPTAKAATPVVPALGSIPPVVSVPTVKVMTPEEQQAIKDNQARATRVSQARNSGLVGKTFGDAASTLATTAQNGLFGSGGNSQPSGTDIAGLKSAAAVDPAVANQQRKIDFLKGLEKEGTSYHPNTAMPPISANELKVGSFIPMVLEQSINSDLPGQVSARVTEDVYDSISGCRLLIPAMSKVIGRYDSNIAVGQGRMLVAWNAMVFPDGSELNLGAMQGYDMSGQAGLESEVNNHYWKMFGVTFGMSMITSSVAMSVPVANPTVNGATAPPTAQQTVATNLAQNFGTLGSQILSKYMAIQPTLTNQAGERFMVVVPRTIVFKKLWKLRCEAAN